MSVELAVVMDGTEQMSVQLDYADAKAERTVLDKAYQLFEMFPDAEVHDLG